ncbi:rhodanese-like domain-containing protein [Rhodococcus coprophilus]|uniref:Sulfurtransferase, rhodanese related n=1 Tax=Rhodococcus coprophilus TaxID=38310 RepID=A0A2X4UJJ0_9NOCA|nr:rhodanese-like domain-containing protein [Rhodococcus coprophilus]MBM7459295.1 rhodanese-related sulfurtransferase [Rhodococcus coprophilus]SQI35748.1 sulfurtransferase, rhodanese related [Rhodococcus coprophilus]
MREIDIEAFCTAWETGATVVDVREDHEYEKEHIPGALWIPLGELGSRLSEVPDAEVVYVICASGRRSLSGADILESTGRRAVSVAGGTAAWLQSGRPAEHGSAR